MGRVIQVHIPSTNFEVENMNLEVNMMEVLLGGSSELLLCWFLQHQHRSCQHLHWSWFHKRILQEVCRRCNWSEHIRTCSRSINLDYGIWTRSLDPRTRGSFQNCIIFNLYYIIINLILFYCIQWTLHALGFSSFILRCIFWN